MLGNDNCAVGECKDERARAGDAALRYCAHHGCQQPGCDAIRGASGYCLEHTCAERTCLLAVSGGDAFCLLHRVTCQRVDCTRSPHTRSSGAVVPFCSRHYCEADGCAGERTVGGRLCAAHECEEEGCAGRRTQGGGRYCEDHECAGGGM
ncbi:hypothetical protein ESCO_001737 [Escovopsis weberi]|uniref:Uncharacterized protein n=1 Tax=Escovopsis weberi TaxID=150374 RepID=A0A0M9VWG0_ESCWE|nr:hypothetical protein ESCO_001737 [Escovopsis weberi]